MITDEDAEFHPAPGGDPSWAETNYFGFYSAEVPLNVGVYALFRLNLGVVHSTVCMNSGDAPMPWRADFCDMRSHLPIPEPRSLRTYALANGLSVATVKPNDTWHIGYDDDAGTSIDVTYQALMPAFDIHDPDMDPITAAQSRESFAWGTAYNGHFDQTGHVQGRVTVRGREVPIDCVSTMDHSWGPRFERGSPNMSWLHAHFSDQLAVHGIFSFDEADGGGALALMHGYVIRDGKCIGLASGRGVTGRDADFYARRLEIRVEDAHGDSYDLRGEGFTRFPWQAWPNVVGFNVLARWDCAGRTGYGEVQDFVDLTRLCEGRAMPTNAAAG